MALLLLLVFMVSEQPANPRVVTAATVTRKLRISIPSCALTIPFKNGVALRVSNLSGPELASRVPGVCHPAQLPEVICGEFMASLKSQQMGEISLPLDQRRGLLDR